VLNTVQQLGVAFGIALLGAIFFDHLASSRGDFTTSFGLTLWFDVGAMALVCCLMFALPRKVEAAW
jgi:hypothetical protein